MKIINPTHFRMPLPFICIMLVLFIVTVPYVTLASPEYSLNDLYRIALEQSEKIKISTEDVYIAERGVDKAIAGLIPKLSAFGNYIEFSTQKYSYNGTLIQPDHSTGWGTLLNQSYSLGGREFISLKMSKRGVQKSSHDLDSTKESYLLSVASTYYQTLRAKRNLDIALENVKRLIKQRDAARVRLKVGEATKTVLLRAEAELSGAESEVVRARNGLDLAIATLARVVGIKDDFSIKESPLQTPESPGDPFEPSSLVRCRLQQSDCFKQIALVQRSELKSLDAQRKISEDQISFAQGAYWPTLSLEGGYLRNQPSPMPVNTVSESLYGSAMLNFPFFEGGLRRAEVREAESKKKQADLSLEDLKKTVSIEVDAAYLSLKTAEGVLKSLEDQLTFAKDNYNAVSKQFEHGLATSIDMIDANTLLTTAERQLSDAQLAYAYSILVLERTTGTFLKTVTSRLTSADNKN